MPKKKTTQKSFKQQTQKVKNYIKQNRKQSIAVLVLTFVVSSLTLAPLLGNVSAAPTSLPSPNNAVETEYGSIGKWMIQPNGEVADYGGQKYQGKTLLEAINVVIVDPTSTSASASKTKVNKAMSSAEFPSRFGHSTGFKGLIDGTLYKQQPTNFLSAYSDDSFMTQNNHGRLFGPASMSGGGYVYSGGFSTEKFAIYNWFPAHVYVSSNMARDALVAQIVASGQTQSADIDMDNAYNTTSTTVGDHDGKAAVVVLK